MPPRNIAQIYYLYIVVNLSEIRKAARQPMKMLKYVCIKKYILKAKQV